MARCGHAIGSIVSGLFLTLSLLSPVQAQDGTVLTAALLGDYVEAQGYVPTEARKDLAQSETYCLGQAIDHEARGEPEDGQWAVASVILNRVESPRYPDTVCDVVFQNAHMRNRCQFSFACDGRPDDGGHGNIIDRESWVKSNLIAQVSYRQHLEGIQHEEALKTALFYHTTAVSPSWASAYAEVASIGNHIFY